MKKYILGALTLCLIIALAGCELTNKVKIDEVGAADLSESYDAGTTLPASKEAALGSIMQNGMEMAQPIMEGAMANQNITDFIAANQTRSALLQFLTNPVAASRAVSGSFSENINQETGAGTITADITVTDEALVSEGSTVATINSITGNFYLKMEADVNGNPTSVVMNAEGDLDIKIGEVGNIKGGKMIAAAKADADATMGYTNGELSSMAAHYNVGFAVSLGVVVSGENGGKYILNSLIKAKGDISATNDTELFSSVNEQLEMVITIEVYNNDNALQSTFTFTDEELTAMFSGGETP
jgi:hypothetical protein